MHEDVRVVLAGKRILLFQEMLRAMGYPDTDRLISDMEEAEEIAIERLRRTQEAQKAAYEELERALANPPPPLDQRAVALGMFEQQRGARDFS